MAWVGPATRTTGTLITAAIWNQDIVDNSIALRAGAIATTNQANGHFIIATSATQLAAKKNSYVRVFQEVFD